MKIRALTGAAIGALALAIVPGKVSANGYYVRGSSAEWGWGGQSMNWEEPNGAVKLRWGAEGGTCGVAYGEFGQHMTSFGCDEGEGVIYHLQPGKRYGFQLRPEGRGAAPVVVGRAKPAAWVQKTPGIGGHNAVADAAATKAGYVYYSPNWVTTKQINGDASVHLTWAPSGDANERVHIRYTDESNGRYKFYTVASGSQGYADVGSLVPGRKYTFSMSRGEWNWSRPMVLRAGSGYMTEGWGGARYMVSRGWQHRGYRVMARRPMRKTAYRPVKKTVAMVRYTR